MTPTDALTALRKPFPKSEIGKLPKISCGACSKAQGKCCDRHEKKKCATCQAWITTGHIHLDYVGHAGVTNRLLDADPAWSWEPVAFDEQGAPLVQHGKNESVMWVRLTVGGVTRYGVGSAPVGSFELHKQLISDAIRNASMRFGVALDLWSKEPFPELVEQEPPAARPKPPLPGEEDLVGEGPTVGGGRADASAPPRPVEFQGGASAPVSGEAPASAPLDGSSGGERPVPPPAALPLDVDVTGGEGTPHESDGAGCALPGPAPSPSGGAPTLDTLRAALTQIPGMGEARALKRAREIGMTELGAQSLPADFADLVNFPAIAQFLLDEWGYDGGAVFQRLTTAQNSMMHAAFKDHGGNTARQAWIAELTGGRTVSSQELYPGEVETLMKHCDGLLGGAS